MSADRGESVENSSLKGTKPLEKPGLQGVPLSKRDNAAAWTWFGTGGAGLPPLKTCRITKELRGSGVHKTKASEKPTGATCHIHLDEKMIRGPGLGLEPGNAF